MFNKEWVHLNRATDEYMKGVWEFVEKVKKDATDVDLIMCPSKDCRNMSHQSFDVVYEHLVIKGMDPTYKIWLKRMFNTYEIAKNLTWHSQHKSNDGKMHHPLDSVAWELIDMKLPDFTMDPRNLRFGLATDGFNPFSSLSSRYSCWPVMLVTYNLPPWLCMKKENIMLTLLIPGPKQPGLLPKGPGNTIMRLCSMFNTLCQRVIDREKLVEIEHEIVETLCLLEKFFPPSFFDIMVHLLIHLGREARLCEPVQFRWMYPFERYMKVLKAYVRNRARPEGCIAEDYLADECVNFSSRFFNEQPEFFRKECRNEELENSVILEGHPISVGISITVDDDDLKNAHRYVLFNTTEIEPFVEYVFKVEA
ncbi:uncharacterized protein E6C27_scaffold80G00030 [Cucumis melo var. makuwa]|uniref:DUF4218 domain-containing protein n=1 Tax=Cucumis melo var. makuwa TaxID=1194695 RepID=A0A5A7UNZ2_CUCMM|nr:uncharacterized protein E6C27_scaffold80G00030 [Cucumis melo var. makuwa]